MWLRWMSWCGRQISWRQIPATSPGANLDCCNDRTACENGLICLHSGVNGSDRWSCGKPQAVSATPPVIAVTSPSANLDCSNDRNVCENGSSCLHSGVNGSDRWSCHQHQPPVVSATPPVIPTTSPGANLYCSNDHNVCENGLTCLHSGVNGSDRWPCGQPQAVSATPPVGAVVPVLASVPVVYATSPIPATPVVPAASPVNYVAPLVPPGTPNLGSCHGAWTINGAYGAGARVAKCNGVYQCKGTTTGLQCPQAGYEPGVAQGRLDFWMYVWDPVGICSGTSPVLPPTVPLPAWSSTTSSWSTIS